MIIGYSYQSFRLVPLAWRHGDELRVAHKGRASRAGITGFSPLGQKSGMEKSLSVRTHICTSCGLILDRDENAAKNIQWAGQALQGAATLVAVLN